MDRKWSVLLAVGVGTFMTALDNSVANIVLPVIGRSFQAEIDSVQWVVTVYLLGISGLLLTFGRLGDLRGHRSVYLWGFGVFVAASALCGLAPSVTVLVACRAVQAIGASMLMANSPAILVSHFPSKERGKALGIQATMTYLGLCAGPSLGGWLTALFGWRAVFYINVPVGLMAFFLSRRAIAVDHPIRGQQRSRFDLWGAALFTLGLVALLLALNQGHAWGWTSAAVVSLMVAAAVLLGVFVRVESRAPSPMLDLTLFRARAFSAATVSAILNYLCTYTVTFLLPFYLIHSRHLGPAQAGAMLTAQPLVMAAAAPVSGTLSDRLGPRLLATPGMVIMSIGLWLLSGLDADSPFWHVTIGLAVIGLGTGIFISPNNSALLGAAPANRRGIASGVLATARSLGMVMGIGLAGAILTTSHARSADQTAGTIVGVHWGFLIAAALALVGAVTSAVRGTKRETENRGIGESGTTNN
jgi:EmrB/QacA subfamily drug resistance transporter